MAGTSDPAGVRGEIGAFLSTRRARISPAQAGLPVFRDEHRRVPGLRREEVAVLAGISTEYYTRFERGNATGVSDSLAVGREVCGRGRPVMLTSTYPVRGRVR